jgi:uncharacterized protein YukE
MDALRDLAKDLKTIADEFKDADGNSDDAAQATGHDELAGKVRDFADKWRIKRQDMTENVVKLQGIIQQIVDTFGKVDADLAKALERAAKHAK